MARMVLLGWPAPPKSRQPPRHLKRWLMLIPSTIRYRHPSATPVREGYVRANGLMRDQADSTGRRNTLMLGASSTTGRRKSARSPRRKLSSPGQPRVRQREHFAGSGGRLQRGCPARKPPVQRRFPLLSEPDGFGALAECLPHILRHRHQWADPSDHMGSWREVCNRSSMPRWKSCRISWPFWGRGHSRCRAARPQPQRLCRPAEDLAGGQLSRPR